MMATEVNAYCFSVFQEVIVKARRLRLDGGTHVSDWKSPCWRMPCTWVPPFLDVQGLVFSLQALGQSLCTADAASILVGTYCAAASEVGG